MPITAATRIGFFETDFRPRERAGEADTAGGSGSIFALRGWHLLLN
jgi:hypothetical protein